MIAQFFVNPNKPKPYYSPVTQHQGMYGGTYYQKQADAKGITIDEYHRRARIVTQCSNLSPAYAGAHMWPKDKEYCTEYGECLIIGVCRNYSDFDKDWPIEGDNPFVITAKSLVTNETFFATGNFFVKAQPKFEEANEQAC